MEKKCFTGSDGNRPLLQIFGIHGWMDNANTYDRLVPGLPSGTELCVLDLPGHGYSDHLPNVLRSEVNNTLKCEKDTDSHPIFSEEEAIKRIIRSRMGGPNNDIVNVDEDAARVLLTRLVKPVSGGLTWRHDRKAVARFKMFNQGSTWFYLIKQIKCPVLYFHPIDSIYDLTPSERNGVFDIFKSEIEFSKCVVVEGAHHVHLTHPYRVLPDITEFLLKLKETTQPSQSKL